MLLEGIIDRITRAFDNATIPSTYDTSLEVRKEYAYDPSAFGLHGDKSGFSSYDWYAKEVRLAVFRRKVYEEYDMMDTESPEVCSAIDIYADNSTQGDVTTDDIVNIVTQDKRVAELFLILKKELGIDEDTWSIARNIAKYGESFEEIVIDENNNIVRLKNLDGRYVRRNEDKYGRLMNKAFTQFREGTEVEEAEFEKWQLVHFRMRKNRNSKYGSGILYPIRKVYKQLTMMEDALVIGRLTRAPQRYAYLVDTTGMTPAQSREHINEVKRDLRKRKTIDPITGRMNVTYNPMSQEEDIFVSVKNGSRADVKTLPGYINTSMSDIEYFQNKLFSGIKVPKAYVGLERDSSSKATLTEQDVQFARSVRRVQCALQGGLKQVINLALILKGIAPSTVHYSLKFPLLSTIDELRKWQIYQLKVNIAATLKQAVNIPNRWIYRELLEMKEKDIEQLEAETEEEMKKNAKLQGELNTQATQQQGDQQLQMQQKQFDLQMRQQMQLQQMQGVMATPETNEPVPVPEVRVLPPVGMLPLSEKMIGRIKRQEKTNLNNLKMFVDWGLRKEIDTELFEEDLVTV